MHPFQFLRRSVARGQRPGVESRVDLWEGKMMPCALENEHPDVQNKFLVKKRQYSALLNYIERSSVEHTSH